MYPDTNESADFVQAIQSSALKTSRNFLFEGPNIDAVRQQFGLGEHNFLAYGSSAEVYQRENTIFRVSTDFSSHCLTVLGNKYQLAVPKLISDYGDVAEDDEDFEYYWLGRFELLQELDTVPALKEQFNRWLQGILATANVDEHIMNDKELLQLRDVLLQEYKSAPFFDVARSLLIMCEAGIGLYDLDLQLANFMYRASSNDIILADPAHQLEFYNDEILDEKLKNLSKIY